ncbi:Uncharacterised protein [uncultured archaeon]|nr:Uncharacterised protein [uncultured archaeon]
MQWDQNTNTTFDLNDYCNDPDNEPLSYSVYNSSENIYASIDNGISTVSSGKNWYGKGFITFKADDSQDSVFTNQITVMVHHVNQAPEFNGTIEDLTWGQNTNLNNAVNLNDYFSDVDNELVFSVSGNSSINVVMNNGIVSFYPQSEWFGSETVVFSATDGEYISESNPILLTVHYSDKPPVFAALNCTTDILEDTGYSCQLDATDPENETVTFSIAESEGLNCTINGNTLSYIGAKDYYGEAFCKVRATDIQDTSVDQLLTVGITNVNDAPVIKDYYPKNIAKIVAGKDVRFTIFPADSDSVITTNWTVNNATAASGTSYTFNKPKGTYQISALVSDGEYNVSQAWSVIVGNINEFTCSEMQGYTCTENQTCSKDFLGVYDTQRCCPVACNKKPPTFSAVRNINSTANKTDNIWISIIDPNVNETLNVGENFTARVNVENRLSQKADFTIEIYLYDLTKEKVISSQKETYPILKDSVRTVNVEFNPEYDLKEEDEYAIYARAIAKDDGNKYYNQDYNQIIFERKNYDVVIESMQLNPEDGILCGDYVDATIGLRNQGTVDENIRISLDSPGLKLSQQSEWITVEKYENDNTAKSKFTFQVPRAIQSGNYTVKASFTFVNNSVISEERSINVECKQEITQTTPVETIKLGQKALPAIPVQKDNTAIFLIISSIMITAVMVIFVVGFIYRNKAMRRIALERHARKEMESAIRKVRRK